MTNMLIDAPNFESADEETVTGNYSFSTRRTDDYLLTDPDEVTHLPISVGPSTRELRPLLETDSYEYSGLLDDIRLREMLASTALTVLDDSDRFTAIVGEDTSGRIPALIIGRALNSVRQRQGLPATRRLFVSGRIYYDHNPDFQAKNPDEHALLVTEYVATGTSVRNSLRALARAGFETRSLAMVDRDDFSRVGDVEKAYMGDANSYTGRSDDHLYKLSESTKGVYKEIGDAHSKRAKIDKNYGSRRLHRIRRDIAHFAQEIVGIWDIRSGDS